ncbi:MAG: hypothetical protein KA821_05430 [Chitinophagaceae bacterium]|nr:hypothetical protein [Chitinophagaceae bacterium]
MKPTLRSQSVITLFCLLLLSFLQGCQKKEPEATANPDNNATLTEWLTDWELSPVSLTPALTAYHDIVFNDGNAAVLDNRNTVSFSYDNGNTWSEKINLGSNRINCIALHPNGEKLFIGGTSLGPYNFGARFWVYNTPRNAEPGLQYQHEAKIVHSEAPILSDFLRASWNGDGSVYASFGRTGYKEGFFGNIVPDGRDNFLRRTPSFSRLNGMPPTQFPTYCRGFVINDAYKLLILSAYEYIPSANSNLMAPYISMNGNKGAGDSWLSLANDWKPGLAQHMAVNKKGNYMVTIGDADRFFINSELFKERYIEVVPKGVQGKLLCTAIDNNNIIWIGTEKGLYKSNKPLPKLFDPFGG